MKTRAAAILSFLIALSASASQASPGSEGAAFLEIPVGAEPAAMGSAYSALASNAYAPVWNPAGLGFLTGNELAGQHVSYLQSINYEFMSFVHPFDDAQNSTTHRGLGFSAQYLGSGDINQTDVNQGQYVSNGGTFSSYYGAYSVAYGQTLLGDKLALGVTGKWINASIDDVTANAYAADFGGLYKLNSKVNLAATFNNIGTQLKFLSQGDNLPMAMHLAASYQPDPRWLLTTEGVYQFNGSLASFHVGGEWRPVEAFALRAGYHTDTLDGLDAEAGVTAGMGLYLWGQEFAYAWSPYGDLGDAQYFSLLIHFGAREEQKRNLIQYQTIKKHRTVEGGQDKNSEPEYQQLMQLLSDEDSHVAQSHTTSNGSGN